MVGKLKINLDKIYTKVDPVNEWFDEFRLAAKEKRMRNNQIRGRTVTLNVVDDLWE